MKWDVLETFAEGQQVTLFKRVAKSIQEQNLVLARAHSLLGKEFNVLNFNCDHLVTYALAGVPTSPQLGAVVGVLALAALASVALAAVSE